MILERTLPAVWTLHGADVPALAPVTCRGYVVVVADVETLCASIVVDVSRSDAPYVPSETSDLYEGLAFLLGRTVEVLPRYDPSRGRRVHDPWTAGFKAWLHDELSLDLIDQWRSWFGRQGHKRLPFEAYLAGEGDAGLHDAGGLRERRVRGSASTDPGDRDDAGGDDRGWLFQGRSREVLREVQALGLGSPPGARGGAAGAGSRGTERLVRAA